MEAVSIVTIAFLITNLQHLSAQACPQYKYGPICQDCICVKANTERCDVSNGRCICKAGYEGETCSCKKGGHFCNLQVSTCQLWFNRHICMCKPQYANSSISGCEIVARLRDGNSSYSGRVEIYRENEWMTVCDDRWSNDNARVICRMLGLPIFYTQGVSGGVFPSGRYPQKIGLDDIQCTGEEYVLTDCNNDLINNCDHNEDAAVICRSECPDWLYGARCANVCDCSGQNTDNCDKVTGFCHCKQGWTGPRCDCSDTVKCNQTYSYCQNNMCICKEGRFSNGVNCSGLQNVLMFCSFESISCPFTQDETDFDGWVLHTGRTPTSSTGPTEANDGHRYMYFEASRQGSGENASLIYNYPSSSSVSCFQFQYHMYGSTMGALKIKRKVISSGREEVMFTRAGNQGNLWQYGSFKVPPDTLKIVIEAVRGSGVRSDIAIDDIFLQKGECGCPHLRYGSVCTKECDCDRANTDSCDKVTGSCQCKPGWAGPKCDCSDTVKCNQTYSYCQNNMCICKDGNFPNTVNCSGLSNLLMFCSFESTTYPLSQDKTDSYDWVLKSSGTPSDETGPKAAKDGHKYMYLEASSMSTGGNATLIYDYPISTSTNCFQFQYHMYGSTMGTLKIKRKVTLSGKEVVMFTRTSNQCNKWTPGNFLIPTGTSKILIEAIRGSGYKSDVAIDNIYIQRGECTCPDKTMKNGRLSVGCLRHKNTACEVICNKGYSTRKGSNAVTCGQNYRWLEDLDNVCKVNICPDFQVKNGTLSPTCLRYATQICKFDCDTGFKPKVGLNYVTCGPLGTWEEDMDGLCEVTETNPPEDGNQAIIIASSAPSVSAVILIGLVVAVYIKLRKRQPQIPENIYMNVRNGQDGCTEESESTYDAINDQ